MLEAAGLVSERSFVDMSYAFLIRHEDAESGLDVEYYLSAFSPLLRRAMPLVCRCLLAG